MRLTLAIFPTKYPLKRVWEVTWATGTRLSRSSSRPKIGVKGDWNSLINRTKFYIPWPSVTDPAENSRISKISALR